MRIASYALLLAAVAVGSNAAADAPGPDVCSSEKVQAVEAALDEESLMDHCQRLEGEALEARSSYAGFWFRSYNRKRNVGLGLTLLVAPMFAAGAVSAWVVTYRNSESVAGTEEDDDSWEEFNRDLGLTFGAILTAITVGVLTTGLALLVVGQQGMTALEPIVDGEPDRPSVAIAPLMSPAGPVGAGMQIHF